MRLSLRTLLLTGAIGAACVLAPVVVIARQPATKTIYMTVLDNKGAPITDLGAAELEVKAGGKAMEIVRMQPGQMPFRIAVIVSDAGTGGFQQGIANFMQKLLGQAEFSLISVITQPQVVSDYSSEGAVLEGGCSTRRTARPGARRRRTADGGDSGGDQERRQRRPSPGDPRAARGGRGGDHARGRRGPGRPAQERRRALRRLDGRCAAAQRAERPHRNFRANRRRCRTRTTRTAP